MRCGAQFGHCILLACLLALGITGGADAWSQSPAKVAATPVIPPDQAVQAPSDSIDQWEGLTVSHISFVGVSADRLVPVAGHLAQAEGAPLNRENLKRSLRQLFSTGMFEAIAAEAVREEGGVALTFRGTPRTFIGTITVDGAKSATLNTQLERSGQLAPGTRYTPARLSQALDQMRATLALNGFHEPVITQTLTPHPTEQLVDLAFHVNQGPRARVGSVDVTGDPGMSVAEFQSHAHLKAGQKVDRETGERALAGVLKAYQHRQRLEAEIKIENQQYVKESQKNNFRFSANQGPIVKVLVDGANISPERLRHAIPIFEEGSVDEDLLNEGGRRLRDYYQRLGYFDVKVEHEPQSTVGDRVTILYKVRLGERRRVEHVSVKGNHYFDSATLKDLLSVHAANSTDRHGAYSQALVTADISAIEAVYKNNGFSKVKITPESNAGGNTAPASLKIAPLAVVYHIEEGEQLRVGKVSLAGNDHVDTAKLALEMNTVAGQLLSPRNLAGDRDELMTDYMSRGFDQVKVDVAQQIEADDPARVDVVFHINEGPQIFVRKVLLTGLHYTRPQAVARAITLHAGDPLNETALMETQRNLYDYALFTEVNTAIENPAGEEPYKTVLLQVTEARRWALTYGFGFEAQTGTPQNNCGGIEASGAQCNPNGKTGISPRVLTDITRNDFFGREQSISLRATYGLLEQKIDLSFQNPHFAGISELRTDIFRWLRQQFGCVHLRGLQAASRNALDRTLQYARLAHLQGQHPDLRIRFPPRQGESDQPPSCPRRNYAPVHGSARRGPGTHLDSRYSRRAHGCAPRHLHQFPGVSLR